MMSYPLKKIAMESMEDPHAIQTEKVAKVGIDVVPTVQVPAVNTNDAIMKQFDSIINTLKRENLEKPDRWGLTKEMRTINALRAALVQCALLNNSPGVVIRIQELLALSVDIIGL
jgi:hypothetical protein